MSNPEASPGLRNKIKNMSFIILFLVIISTFFALSPIFTINQGELGIVLRFGKAVRIAQPGLNFKIPFTDQAIILSVRNEKRIYNDLQSYSRDVQEASIRLSVNYRIKPETILDLYSKFGTNYVERMIDPVVPERLKEVFGQYQATTVVSDRVGLGEMVEDRIRASMPEEIIIDSVQIENIDFSDVYEKAIEAAAQAEAEVRKSRNELEREKVEAEKKIVQAQAQAAQIKERAIAESEAIRLKGEAEAKAIGSKAKAFLDNPAYSNLVAVEKWNGTLPQTMVPGSALPFISIPSGEGPAPQPARR